MGQSRLRDQAGALEHLRGVEMQGDAGPLWALHELLVKHFYLNMVTRVKCGRLKHLGVSVSS